VRRESLIVLGALGAGLVSTGAGAAGSAPVSRWLRWDAATHTASLTLIAGYNGANNGFNFDGYGRGRLLVLIPRGWRVTVICENAASMRHSCAIVRGPLTVAPAFPGATTPSPTLGLRAGQSARFTFKASTAGTYRIACLVPGHEQARMWDVLVVGKVRRPSISTQTGF
jgi:Sulfocyanin (SoxE) domain